MAREDQEAKDLRWVEALMKAIWGTDQRCREPVERAETDAMLERAERRVERLRATLDHHPPRNIDETMRQITGSHK